MALLSTVANTLGMILLAHAVYSAYEHTVLISTTNIQTPSSSSSGILHSLNPKIDLPLDVTLETLFSVSLLCLGVVLSSPALKPIQWNVWAGQLERSKDARVIKEVGVGGGNPYASLEERPGFLDIRGKQKAFVDWMEDGEMDDKITT